MSAPFEKFVLQSNGVNDFHVRVASPDFVRESLHDFETFKKSNEESIVGYLMMRRYLFIEDAIREKLEREKSNANA